MIDINYDEFQPLKPSRGKGFGRVCGGEAPDSTPNGDKNLPIRKDQKKKKNYDEFQEVTLVIYYGDGIEEDNRS